MKKIILSIILLGGANANAQQLLEVLRPHTTNTFTPSEKCLERVKDRNYGDGDHNFIYCAVQGPNGKKWLNLNLGAEYAKESSPYFNPEAIPTDYNDWKAFGSQFQMGRNADGHELVKYRHSSLGNSTENDYWELERIYNITDIKQPANNESNNLYWSLNKDEINAFFGELDYTQEAEIEEIFENMAKEIFPFWMNSLDKIQNNWRGNMYNNPCPQNYRVMNTDDFIEFIGSHKDNLDFSKIGGASTTSVIHNLNTPNLFVMMAPAISYEGNDSLSKIQISESVVSHLNNTSSGTSSIWSATVVKADPENDYRMTNYYVMEYDEEGNILWRGESGRILEGLRVILQQFLKNDAIIDHKFYTLSGMYEHDYGMVFTDLEIATRAVRCVEM